MYVYIYIASTSLDNRPKRFTLRSTRARIMPSIVLILAQRVAFNANFPSVPLIWDRIQAAFTIYLCRWKLSLDAIDLPANINVVRRHSYHLMRFIKPSIGARINKRFFFLVFFFFFFQRAYKAYNTILFRKSTKRCSNFFFKFVFFFIFFIFIIIL